MRNVYSEHETKLARELIARKATDVECRERLGRSKKALQLHLRTFNRETAERVAPIDPAHPTGTKRAYSYVAPRPQPSAEQVEAASRRVCSPRTLTASIFGDPAPGNSALDIRNGGARV